MERREELRRLAQKLLGQVFIEPDPERRRAILSEAVDPLPAGEQSLVAAMFVAIFLDVVHGGENGPVGMREWVAGVGAWLLLEDDLEGDRG